MLVRKSTVFTPCIGKDNVDPDQTPWNAVSDLGLHCLPFIGQYLDTSAGRIIEFLNFYGKYGKNKIITPDKVLFSTEKY